MCKNSPPPLDEITTTAIWIAFVQGRAIARIAQTWDQTPETIEEILRQVLIAALPEDSEDDAT